MRQKLCITYQPVWGDRRLNGAEMRPYVKTFFHLHASWFRLTLVYSKNINYSTPVGPEGQNINYGIYSTYYFGTFPASSLYSQAPPTQDPPAHPKANKPMEAK